MPHGYLDITAVAERAGVTAATIRKYRATGRMPDADILLGQSPGWHPETIEAWLQARPGRGVGGGRPRKT